MTAIGTLALYNAPGGSLIYTMNFFSLHFPEGFPYDTEQLQSEPLRSRGVDNTRQRILNSDFNTFIMEAHSEAGTFAAAAALALVFKGYKNFLGILSFNAGGTTFSPTDYLYLWEVMPTPYPAQFASTVASSSSLGGVFTRFHLQFSN